jgi:putative DNA primase/helicase
MSIDLSRLEKPRNKGGKTIARCPACAETGNDNNADHLYINAHGKYGCVLYQGADGNDHRKRIFELVGISDQKPTKQTYTALRCAPSNETTPSLNHYKHGKPVAHWKYHTINGKIAGIVARYNLPNGKKETLPMTWCENEHGETSWQFKAMPSPRPLYGLPFKSDTIVLVEGEKTAEAIRSAGFEATTWAGGCAAINKSDFTTLTGKKVILWADNDAPGMRAMNIVSDLLNQIADLFFVKIPNNVPNAWDAADTTSEHISEIINSAARLTPDPITCPEPPPDVFEPEQQPEPKDRIMDMPFRMLGMDDGIMRYMPDNGQHIVSLSPPSHTKLNLIQLAPLQVWESTFPSKNGADWDAASNALIQVSQSMPKFDPRSIRGRGCWVDGEDVIYHAGNKLSVNGAITPIPNYNSPTRAIYEAGLSISLDAAETATNAQASKLIELCESLSWDHPLYGKLIAGWMALAPICGAMAWRPHVWVTGAAGTGKSWVMNNVVHPMLGRSVCFVQGNTTEAGIRGQLGSDALPVMFDEAESENDRGANRMQSVLELARQASTESGAGITKGTASGGSITYMVRSMFCFSSIGVAAVKKADTSRVSQLSLKKCQDSHFETAIKKLWAETTANHDYCAKMRSRAIKNAYTTRHNAEVFARVAVPFTGDKRNADQIGTLLAGAFSLTSTRKITPETAKSWMEKQDWSNFKTDELDSDENQCLAHLMASPIRIERMNGSDNMTIDEAICVNSTDCDQALARIGIKNDDDGIRVAYTHQGLEKAFSGTPWSGAKWKGQLLRIANSQKSQNPVRFTQNVVSRAVFLPK